MFYEGTTHLIVVHISSYMCAFRLGEQCAWNYLCDLLLALSHLHSQGFAHLDLKPANVFLTHSGRLKLGDFGLLLEVEQRMDREQGMARRKKEKDDAQEGDPRYMAPELLRGEYGAAADIFRSVLHKCMRYILIFTFLLFSWLNETLPTFIREARY